MTPPTSGAARPIKYLRALSSARMRSEGSAMDFGVDGICIHCPVDDYCSYIVPADSPLCDHFLPHHFSTLSTTPVIYFTKRTSGTSYISALQFRVLCSYSSVDLPPLNIICVWIYLYFGVQMPSLLHVRQHEILKWQFLESNHCVL